MAVMTINVVNGEWVEHCSFFMLATLLTLQHPQSIGLELKVINYRVAKKTTKFHYGGVKNEGSIIELAVDNLLSENSKIEQSPPSQS